MKEIGSRILLFLSSTSLLLKIYKEGPAWVVQWVRTSSRYAEVVGFIPCQGTDKKQSANERVITGITN